MTKRSIKKPVPEIKTPTFSQRSKDRLDHILDRALADSFPASDPLSVTAPVSRTGTPDRSGAGRRGDMSKSRHL
jgi:hypothetical protein